MRCIKFKGFYAIFIGKFSFDVKISISIFHLEYDILLLFDVNRKKNAAFRWRYSACMCNVIAVEKKMQRKSKKELFRKMVPYQDYYHF